MSNSQAKQRFLDSEEAKLIRQELLKMVADPQFNTKPTYTTESLDDMLFVDRHLKYMSDHANIKPEHYLSNLRLKTRLTTY